MDLAAVGGEDHERGHVAQAEVGFHAVHGALGDDAERAGVRVELGTTGEPEASTASTSAIDAMSLGPVRAVQ